MNDKYVVVIGGGVLGSQIAYQAAYCGFNVTLLVREEDSQDEIKKKLKKLHKTYIETIELMAKEGRSSSNWARGLTNSDKINKRKSIKKADEAYKNIIIETDQPKALYNADYIIESITENFDIKRSLYEQIAPYLKDEAILVTNSSTLLPSKLAKYTGRPSRYLTMHFANTIWKNNIAEIMRHSGTDNDIFDEVIKFAEQIQMIPLPVREEKSGYLLNSMLVPFLLCAMDLLANGISDPVSIDKAWTLGTGAPKGPFQILDTVGLITAREIVMQYQKVPNIFDPLLKKMMLPYNYDGMLAILNKYIDEGKLGKSTGEGFYKYDK